MSHRIDWGANPEAWQEQFDRFRDLAVESRRKAELLKQALRAPDGGGTSLYPKDSMQKDLAECLKDAQDAEDAMREHLKYRPPPPVRVSEVPVPSSSASEGPGSTSSAPPVPAPAPNAADAAGAAGAPSGDIRSPPPPLPAGSSGPDRTSTSPECSLAPTPTIDRSSFRTTRVLSPARSKPPSPAVQDREDTSTRPNDEEEGLDSHQFLGKQLEVHYDDDPSDMSHLLDSPGEEARQERLRRKQSRPSDHRDGTLSPTSMADSLQSLKFVRSRVLRAASSSSSRRQVSTADDDDTSSDDDSSDDEDLHYSPPQYLKDIGIEDKRKEWLIAQANSNEGIRQMKKAFSRVEKRLLKSIDKVSTRQQVSGIDQKIDLLGTTTGVALATFNSKLDTIIELKEETSTLKEETSTLKAENGQLRKEREELMAQIAAIGVAKAAAVSSSRPCGGTVTSTHGRGAGGGGDAILPSDLALTDSAAVLGPTHAGAVQTLAPPEELAVVPPAAPSTEPSVTIRPAHLPGALLTDRPTSTPEPPSTNRTITALADSSTVELVSSSTDNLRLPAPNNAAGTIEEATAVVSAGAAPPHGNTIASADITTGTKSGSKSNTSDRSGSRLMKSTGAGKPTASLLMPKATSRPSTSGREYGKENDRAPSVAGSPEMAEVPPASKNRAGVNTKATAKTLKFISLRSRSTNVSSSIGSNDTEDKALVKAFVNSSEGNSIPCSFAPGEFREMLPAKSPLPVVSYRDVDYTEAQRMTILQAIPVLKPIIDRRYGDADKVERVGDTLLDCVEKGGLFHPRCRLPLMQFICDFVNVTHLNHSRPKLAKCFHALYGAIANQFLTMSSVHAKPLLPLLLLMSSEFLVDPYGPMSNKNVPIMESARHCANRFSCLLSAKEPTQFSFIARQLCSAIIDTDRPTQKIGCAEALAIAVEISPRDLIVSLERGTSKKKTKGLLSRACADLLTGRIGDASVRKAGKLCYHRLKVNGYCDVAAEIVKKGKLSTSQKEYLRKAEAAAEKEWAANGAKWLRENGHLN